MKWEEMTTEEKNLLVAEKVMGWAPHECEYDIGELPISPDGWYCQRCGYTSTWGDDVAHDAIPPRYTESLDAAWLVVREIQSLEVPDYEVYTQFIHNMEKIVGSNLFFDLFYCDKERENDHLTPERLCLAALIATGSEIEWQS